jgi:hypothetical protein
MHSYTEATEAACLLNANLFIRLFFDPKSEMVLLLEIIILAVT